jgi:nitric oxide reductase subunit B
MLTATASLFTIGVGLFIFDFFRYAPSFAVRTDAQPELPLGVAANN